MLLKAIHQRLKEGLLCLPSNQTTKLFRTMKLTTLLILVACLQVSASTNAQVTISYTNVPIEKIFDAIADQTDYLLFYTDKVIKDAKPVTINVKNQPVETILQLALKDQPLIYQIRDKNIFIIRKPQSENNSKSSFNIDVSPYPVEDTTIDVRGRVINDKNEPVASATVIVKGTGIGTHTDNEGKFYLKSVPANAMLIISAVSIESKEIKVGGNRDLQNISVKTKISEEEVVTIVNTGYQKLPKERATGSFTFISEEQLDQRVAPDILSKLEGITNGLVFNKAAQGSDRIRIRGESTIFANADPLIIVDNFPYDGDISNINPNDVESITILKDAAAASIWGVQAGNGVIVITTKRGKINRPMKIELNVAHTISEKPNLFYRPNISTSDYIDFETFLFSKGYYDGRLSDPNLPAVSPVVEILNKRRTGLISAEDSMQQIDALRNNDYRHDFLKYVYRRASHQQYQLNLSGGSRNTAYYFSAGFDKNALPIYGTQNNRIVINTQASYQPIKKAELRLGLVYTEANNEEDGTSTSINNFYPYMKLVDESENALSVPQYREEFEDTISKYNYLDWKFRPLKDWKTSVNNSRIFDTRLLLAINYVIVKGLNVDISYQYNRSNTRQHYLIKKENYTIRNLMNRFAILDVEGNYKGSHYPAGGRLTVTNSDLIGHYGRGILNYNASWNNHALMAIAGFEVRETRRNSNGSTFYGFNEETGTFYSASADLYTSFPMYPRIGSTGTLAQQGAISFQSVYGGTMDRFRSYFANIAYRYLDRYIVSGSARLDGSNYFGVKANNRTVPLWSAGVKWEISKEDFLSAKYFSQLVFRVTYGYNGNLDKNSTAVATIQYNRVPSTLTGLPYAIVNNIPNPQLRWEKMSHFNVGIDFVTSNKRISGSVEYYLKKGNDLIGDKPIDPTTGVNQLRGNFSGMKAHGADIQISTVNIDKNFRWSTSFLFNYTNEKVTRFDLTYTGSDKFTLTAHKGGLPVVGKPLYALYSYRWAGLDPETGDPRIYLSDTIFKNTTSAVSSQFKLEDHIFNGRYNPPITGSVLNSLSWKNLTLALNIVYKLNYVFRRTSIEYTALRNDWKNGHGDYVLRWKKPGDETITNVPSFTYPINATRDTYYSNSDILVEKGDHIRLQFINVSYQFDEKVLKRSSISSLQVYFYANNLGLIWRRNDKEIDPDFPTRDYPTPTSYSFGIRCAL